MRVATGTFTKESTDVPGTDQEILGLGFAPKALILWGSRQITSEDSLSQGTNDFMFGMQARGGEAQDPLSAGGGAGSCSFSGEDGQGTTDTHSNGSTPGNSVIRAYDVVNSVSGDLTAQVLYRADGFALNWSNSSPDASIMHYIAFGGEDIEAECGDLPHAELATGNKSYTWAGSRPGQCEDGKAIIFFMTRHGSTSFGNASWSFGCAVSPSKEAVIGIMDDGGVVTTDTGMSSDSDACLHVMTAGSPTTTGIANFVSWDNNGFTLNWSEAGSGESDCIYMVIKGGQWDCGIETALTSGSTKATTTDFRPKALIAVSTLRTSDGVGAMDSCMCFGASAGDVGNCALYSSEDGVGTSVIGRGGSNLKVIKNIIPSSVTVDGEAEVDSFNETDFTLDWTNLDSTAKQFLWIAGTGKDPIMPQPVSIVI